jgi:hypothetical protein
MGEARVLEKVCEICQVTEVGEPMRGYSYIVANDNNHAPCLQDGMLSFCNCKVPIRGSGHAVEGTYMVGCSKAGHGNTLLYFWKIGEVMSRETYLSQFPNRHDSIYRVDQNGGWKGTGFSPLPNRFHQTAKAWEDDLSVNRVFTASYFHYFGRNIIGGGPHGISVPERFQHLIYKHIGRKVVDISQDFIDWVEAQAAKKGDTKHAEVPKKLE